MYAIYKYINGATAAQVLSDVTAILTGTTDVSVLSASCDKAGSSIISTTPAGWTVHDAAAGTNKVALKAPVYDNAAQFKYLIIDTSSAGYVGTISYEFWNATSHTGTNVFGNTFPSVSGQRVNYANVNGGYIYISASIRHAIFTSLSSNTNFGNGINSISGTSEFERWSPWDTSTAGYPNFIDFGEQLGSWGSGNAGSYFANGGRIKRANGTDVNNVQAFLSTSGALDNVNLTNNKVQNASGVLSTLALPLFVSNFSDGTMQWLGGNITSKSDLWLAPYNLGTQGDEITISGQQYVIWGAATFGANYRGTNRMFVPKG